MIPFDIDIDKMRKGLSNGVEVMVVFGFGIRPSLIDGCDNLLKVIILVHDE